MFELLSPSGSNESDQSQNKYKILSDKNQFGPAVTCQALSLSEVQDVLNNSDYNHPSIWLIHTFNLLTFDINPYDHPYFPLDILKGQYTAYFKQGLLESQNKIMTNLLESQLSLDNDRQITVRILTIVYDIFKVQFLDTCYFENPNILNSSTFNSTMKSEVVFGDQTKVIIDSRQDEKIKSQFQDLLKQPQEELKLSPTSFDQLNQFQSGSIGSESELPHKKIKKRKIGSQGSINIPQNNSRSNSPKQSNINFEQKGYYDLDEEDSFESFLENLRISTVQHLIHSRVGVLHFIKGPISNHISIEIQSSTKKILHANQLTFLQAENRFIRDEQQRLFLQTDYSLLKQVPHLSTTCELIAINTCLSVKIDLIEFFLIFNPPSEPEYSLFYTQFKQQPSSLTSQELLSSFDPQNHNPNATSINYLDIQAPSDSTNMTFSNIMIPSSIEEYPITTYDLDTEGSLFLSLNLQKIKDKFIELIDPVYYEIGSMTFEIQPLTLKCGLITQYKNEQPSSFLSTHPLCIPTYFREIENLKLQLRLAFKCEPKNFMCLIGIKLVNVSSITVYRLPSGSTSMEVLDKYDVKFSHLQTLGELLTILRQHLLSIGVQEENSIIFDLRKRDKKQLHNFFDQNQERTILEMIDEISFCLFVRANVITFYLGKQSYSISHQNTYLEMAKKVKDLLIMVSFQINYETYRNQKQPILEDLSNFAIYHFNWNKQQSKDTNKRKPQDFLGKEITKDNFSEMIIKCTPFYVIKMEKIYVKYSGVITIVKMHKHSYQDLQQQIIKVLCSYFSHLLFLEPTNFALKYQHFSRHKETIHLVPYNEDFCFKSLFITGRYKLIILGEQNVNQQFREDEILERLFPDQQIITQMEIIPRKDISDFKIAQFLQSYSEFDAHIKQLTDIRINSANSTLFADYFLYHSQFLASASNLQNLTIHLQQQENKQILSKTSQTFLIYDNKFRTSDQVNYIRKLRKTLSFINTQSLR